MFSSVWCFFKKKLIIILLMISLCILLIPYTSASFWSDDFWLHFLRPALRLNNTSLSAFIIGKIKVSYFATGRILFIFMYELPIFYYIRNQLVYHLIINLALLLNVLIFVIVLKKMKFNNSFISLSVLILFLLFHINGYHDAIISFCGLYQIFGSLLLLSIYYILLWNESYKIKYMFISLFIVYLTLLVYELNVIYFPIAWIIIASSKQKDKIFKPLLISFSAFVFYVVYEIVLKKIIIANSYDGSNFGEIKLILPTYFKQLISSFPGSFFLYRDFNFYKILDAQSTIVMLISIVLFISIYWFLFMIFFKKIIKDKHGIDDNKKILFFIFTLFVIPIIISVSKKYQIELSEASFGVGYLPIYYQYFPTSVICTFLLIKLSKYVNRVTIYVLILIISFFSVVVFLTNNYYLANGNAVVSSYDKLYSLGNEGGLSSLKDCDIILPELDFTHTSGLLNFIIYDITNKKILVPDDLISSNIYTPPFLPLPKNYCRDYHAHQAKYILREKNGIWELSNAKLFMQESNIYLKEKFNNNDYFQWSNKNSELIIKNFSESRISSFIFFKISIPNPKNGTYVKLYENGKFVEEVYNDTKESFTKYKITLNPNESAKLSFVTNANRVDAPLDPREMYFQLVNLKLSSESDNVNF